MSVTVRGRVPDKWGKEAVSHLTRRLQALERALAGGRDRFLTPATPAFGAGAVSGGAGATAPTPDPGTVTVIEQTEIVQIAVQPSAHTHSVKEVHDLDGLPPRLPIQTPFNPAADQVVIADQVFGG